MPTEKQRRTFISYSSLNREFALNLARELRSSGFNIWFDQLDIPTGSRWDDEIEHALEECEIFMVILTPASSASDNVKDEIGYAIDTQKRILPVLLENATVPLRLRRFQYVDFRSKSFEEGVESAKRLLRNLIEEPTIPRTIRPPVASVQKAEEVRTSEEEAERLAKAESDLKAKEDAERKEKEESDRLAAQKIEADRKAKAEAARLAKVEIDRKAKEDAERKAKEEADRLAGQKAKAEIDRKAKEDAKRKAKEESDRLAAQKIEADRKAKAEAARLAKVEADRKAKEDAERKAKEESDRLAAQKIEADRKSKEEDERKKPADVPNVSKKLEPVSSASTSQRRPMSRGLLYGILGVVAIVIIGIGSRVMSSLASDPSEIVTLTPTTGPIEQALTTQNVVKEPTSTSKPAPTNKPTTAPIATSTIISTPTPTIAPVVDIAGLYDVYASCGDFSTTGTAEIAKGTGNNYDIVFNYVNFSDNGTGEWDGEKYKVWYPGRQALQTFILVPGDIFILRGTYLSGSQGCLWSDDLVKRK